MHDKIVPAINTNGITTNHRIAFIISSSTFFAGPNIKYKTKRKIVVNIICNSDGTIGSLDLKLLSTCKN